jgi:hypothetical protein
MANTIGRINYSVSVIPEELVTQLASQKGSNWSDIYTRSTEIGVSSGDGTTEALTILDSGDSNDGYLNQAPFYAQITTTSSAAITGLTNVEFVYFKHTGYRFSSTSELSTTTNTTDHLEVRADSAAGAVIAIIPANGAIALPVQSGTSWTTVADRRDTSDYFFQSVNPDDLTAGAQNIAMEFIAVSAN